MFVNSLVSIFSAGSVFVNVLCIIIIIIIIIIITAEYKIGFSLIGTSVVQATASRPYLTLLYVILWRCLVAVISASKVFANVQCHC